MSKIDQSRMTVLQAIKFFDVSKSTLYNLINTGKLTKDSNSTLDKVDLLARFEPRKDIPKEEKQDNKEEGIATHQNALQGENTLLKVQLDLSREQVKSLQEQVQFLTGQVQFLGEQLKQATRLLENVQGVNAGLSEKLLALPVGSRRSAHAVNQARNEQGKFAKAEKEGTPRQV